MFLGLIEAHLKHTDLFRSNLLKFPYVYFTKLQYLFIEWMVCTTNTCRHFEKKNSM